MPRPDNDNQPQKLRKFATLAAEVICRLIALAVITQLVAGALE